MRIGWLLPLASCAHATFEPRIEPVGEWRPTAPLVEQAMTLPPDTLRAIVVAEGRLPEGLVIEDDQVKVTDRSRYEIVAQVSTQYDMPRAIAAALGVGFYRYDTSEAWKNPYCNVQVPLGWLTLGLWTAMPFHYPCMVAEGDTPEAEDRRRQRILEALVRATAASGANLLVLTELGDLKIITYTDFGTMISSLGTVAGAGVAIRDKTRGAPPAP